MGDAGEKKEKNQSWGMILGQNLVSIELLIRVMRAVEFKPFHDTSRHFGHGVAG